MIVLGIDTATRTASVAILDGDLPVAERRVPGAHSLAATVLPLVQQVVSDANCELDAVDLIAVSNGPGSFTGLRIGLSVAKGLALSLRRPVVGVPTLEALAHVALGYGGGRAWDSRNDAGGASARRRDIICPVLDARRGEIYGALFRRGDGPQIERLTADFATEPQALATKLRAEAADRTCVMVGDGAEPYRLVWEQAVPGRLEILPFSQFGPCGSVVAEIGRRIFVERGGGDSVALLVPRYCRVSDAERKASARGELSTEGSRGTGEPRL